MLHLIFCSLSSLTSRDNIFIKVSVVWFVLSGCRVCPILYISGERVCTLQPGLLACQWSTVQTLCLSRKSICIRNLNSDLKKDFKPPNLWVSCELWMTLRSYSQMGMWNDCSYVLAGGLSTWQDYLCECKSYSVLRFLLHAHEQHQSMILCR